MQKNQILRKELAAVGIIILFVGTSFLPITNGNNEIKVTLIQSGRATTEEGNLKSIKYFKNISLDDAFVNGIDSNYMDYPNQCIVINGIVYVVALYSNALVIVNATNPTHLTEISHKQDGTYLIAPRDVAVTNDSKYCYVITYETNSHLSMWDVSNKLSPARVNQIAFNGETGMVCIMDASNNYLYVCTQSEVRIVNITNKADHQMNVMCTFHTGMGSTHQIWLAVPFRNTLYVSNYDNVGLNGYGWFVYDITDKTSPNYIRTLNATMLVNLGCPIYTYHGFDYFIYQARVHTSYWRSFFIAWNVSMDPNNPTFMWSNSTLRPSGNYSCGGIAIINGYIFIGNKNNNVSAYNNGVDVWNITNVEEKPRYMGGIYGGGPPNYLIMEHELEFDRNGSDATLFGLSQDNDALVALNLTWSGYENQPPVANFTYTVKGLSVLFFASSSYDPDGYIMSWHWEFGDTTQGSGEIITHNYSVSGTYTVNLTVTDNDGDTDSAQTIITVSPNHPPNAPTITGPAQGKIKIGTDYNFTTTDPNSDNVSYFIDWGDHTNSSWLGPYLSGVTVTESHTWTAKGTYIIKAKAKDSNGDESNWSTLQVTMPLSYEPPTYLFLIWLLQRFPNAFPILRHLLGY